MVTRENLVTVDQFEAFLTEHREFYYELINGEIVEKVPTQLHAHICVNLTFELQTFLKAHPLGRAYVEARYRVPTDDLNSRQPDISYVSDISKPIVERGAAFEMPDLAIEVQSPDDSVRQMRERAAYYLANGVRLVWLIYPEKRFVEVYTKQNDQILTIDDTLDGGDVLPGFTLPVRTVFGS